MADSSKSAKEKDDLKKQKAKERLKQLMWAAKLPPINNNDPEQVRARIMLYFEYCEKNGCVVGKEGLCNALKINLATFKSWLDGSARNGQEHQRICQEADQMLKAYMESAMLSGDMNPIPGIFFMSNQHGYQQKTTITQETQQSIIDTATPEQLEARYSSGSIIDVAFEEVKPKKELAEVSSNSRKKAERKKIE